MKVRYIGAQEVSSSKGRFFKLFFSLPRQSFTSDFTNDDGVKVNLEFTGEKPFDMPCTDQAFDDCQLMVPGTEVELRIDPNPFNPRNNIIGGVSAAAKVNPTVLPTPEKKVV